MSPVKNPAFNVRLLQLTPQILQQLQPVDVVDIFDAPGSTDFHPQGIYSTQIFSHVGDPKRDITFGYIDIKTNILHPFTFDKLVKLKKTYADLIAGKEYFIFDEKEGEFIPSTPLDGETGYAFFMKHWSKMKFKESGSKLREKRIEFLNKYRHDSLINKIVVLPAGLRDIEVDSLGRVKEPEVFGESYRKLISISRSIANNSKLEDPINDRPRNNLQNTFNVIFNYIVEFMSGKSGFAQQNLASRKTLNGVRNVITAAQSSPNKVGDKSHPSIFDTTVGLWHLTRGALPVARSRLKVFLQPNFGSSEGMAYLVNPKTLKGEYVKVTPAQYDRWNTAEGLEKVINSLGSKDRRNRPVEVDEHYLALVYAPVDKPVFKVFYSITDLPDGFDKKDVHPITLMELLYLCNFEHWNELPVMVTRYPIADEGSSFPSPTFLKTTYNSIPRKQLNEAWELLPEAPVAISYPDFKNPKYFDATAISVVRLAGLGGDHDGDQLNIPVAYYKESIEEIRNFFKKRSAYINDLGRLRMSFGVVPMNLVMHSLTEVPEDIKDAKVS